jgi:hypothetical protein
MMDFTELASVPSYPLARSLIGCSWQRLRTWRFKGSSPQHTESDLRCYLAWCTGAAWTR